MKKITIIAAALLVLTVNCAGVFAATPVPSKSNASNTTSSTTSSSTSTDTSSSSTSSSSSNSQSSSTVATSKPKSKATSKPTEKASSTKSSSKSKATEEPSAAPTEDVELEVSEKPTSPATSNQDPLVFTQEADEAIIGVETSGAVNSNRYTTKGGSFGWFVLSVIVNAIISFIIGNRFYKMGRKDKHILAEIRALKRDVDAKMQSQIGGFSEYETVIENTNKDLGDGEEKVEVAKSEEDQKAEDMANEIYRKWESQIAAARERETQSRARTSSRTVKSKKNGSSLTGKVKDFINDVFPFDKD